MSRPKVRLNNQVMREIMKSSQTRQILKELGDEVQGRCGAGFDVQVNVSPLRARATVMAVTSAAKRRQARDHVLERAVGGG